MTTIIIQARMGSTRLPGKSMLMLDGYPVIQHVVARCRATKYQTVVATPNTPDNRPIWDLCKQNDVQLYKGHPTDLLKRYADCARMIAPDADVFIRITADCPFINTELIVLTERLFRMSGAKGYMGFNTVHGLNIEVFDRDTLFEAEKHGPDEHCTTWMRQNSDIPFPSLELNTPEDYERLSTIYQQKI